MGNLTPELIQSFINNLKGESKSDSTLSDETVLILPSRVHDEDIACEIILDDPGYQHLHMPINEASVDWFEETFRDRLNADAIPVILTSKIHGE